jgi:hypothetical protein
MSGQELHRLRLEARAVAYQDLRSLASRRQGSAFLQSLEAVVVPQPADQGGVRIQADQLARLEASAASGDHRPHPGKVAHRLRVVL